jgi:hypothetical protein
MRRSAPPFMFDALKRWNSCDLAETGRTTSASPAFVHKTCAHGCGMPKEFRGGAQALRFCRKAVEIALMMLRFR